MKLSEMIKKIVRENVSFIELYDKHNHLFAQISIPSGLFDYLKYHKLIKTDAFREHLDDEVYFSERRNASLVGQNTYCFRLDTVVEKGDKHG